jgi:polyhydroxyalkanoate synthesis regulator phasin
MNILLSLFHTNAYRLNSYAIPTKIYSQRVTLTQSLSYYEQKLKQLLSLIESAQKKDHPALLMQLSAIEEQILDIQHRIFSLSTSQKESLISHYSYIRQLYLRALISFADSQQVTQLQKRVDLLKEQILSLP